MPLYEYECQQCHRHTEKIQKFSDAEITVCPHCGGTLQRVITAPAIAFKGSGWYKDLYSSPKPAATGTESKGEGNPSSDPSAKAGNAGADSSATPAAAPSEPAPAAPPATPAASTVSKN